MQAYFFNFLEDILEILFRVTSARQPPSLRVAAAESRSSSMLSKRRLDNALLTTVKVSHNNREPCVSNRALTVTLSCIPYQNSRGTLASSRQFFHGFADPFKASSHSGWLLPFVHGLCNQLRTMADMPRHTPKDENPGRGLGETTDLSRPATRMAKHFSRVLACRVEPAVRAPVMGVIVHQATGSGATGMLGLRTHARAVGKPRAPAI